MLLIHGTGGTRGHWDPVRDRLAAQRSLLLVDLPGHGESPSPRSAPSNPIGYAGILAGVLDELGHRSVHVAGNSVGGWTALELAKLGRARSVVAIAPAGLWPNRNPRSAEMKLRGQYRMGRRFAQLTPRLMRSPVGRSVLMRGTVARPRQVPADAAAAMAAEYAATPRLRSPSRVNQRRALPRRDGHPLPRHRRLGREGAPDPEKGAPTRRAALRDSGRDPAAVRPRANVGRPGACRGHDH